MLLKNVMKFTQKNLFEKMDFSGYQIAQKSHSGITKNHLNDICSVKELKISPRNPKNDFTSHKVRRVYLVSRQNK